MDKIKEKLHIGSNKKSTEPETGLGTSEHSVGTIEGTFAPLSFYVSGVKVDL